MSLWTPKDASRPLWTPGRKPPSYTGRRLLLLSFSMEYYKNSEGRERGYHQRGGQIPGGGLSPSDGRGGRAGLGLASRGGGRGCRITLRPLPPSRVESPGSTGADHDVICWRQPTGQQPAPSYAPTVTPDAGRLWTPPCIIGSGRLGDTPTTPLYSSDIKHVALSQLFKGDWFNDPDPIADGSAEEDVGDTGRDFPYLQLHPPHCNSCMCQCPGARGGLSRSSPGFGQRTYGCQSEGCGISGMG